MLVCGTRDHELREELRGRAENLGRVSKEGGEENIQNIRRKNLKKGAYFGTKSTHLPTT